jgi:nucleoside-diphosphate-sugar epimerase
VLRPERGTSALRVLVLGGSGFIGGRIAQLLRADGAVVAVASRRGGPGRLALDTRDAGALVPVLRQVDAVVDAVAGSADAIAGGARALARAARAAQVGQVVHLGSMAVYGEQQGLLGESAPLAPARGWYARAKREAEEALAAMHQQGVPVTVLRPGCVWGPGSALWVGRIARWLASGRLGELGPGGDGWSNGVHVDDVARAVQRCLADPGARGADDGGPRIFNLAAPDSPRWNDYLRDLALAIGATPLRRIGPMRLWMEAWVAGPPLHLARRLREMAGSGGGAAGQADPPGAGKPAMRAWPDAISPGLLALWRRPLRLDASAAQSQLGLDWTPYEVAVRQGAAWWLTQCAGRCAPPTRFAPPA